MTTLVSGDVPEFDMVTTVMTDNNTTDFCSISGMAMTMYMNGFQWSTSTTPTLLPCLTYLVPSWQLQEESQFQGALVYSFLLALLLEILSSLRTVMTHSYQDQYKKAMQQQQTTNHPGTASQPGWLWWQHAGLSLVIYTLQTTLGFGLMFLAMSFSIEILLCTLAGFMVGNLTLFRYKAWQPTTRRRRLSATTHAALQQPLLATSSQS